MIKKIISKKGSHVGVVVSFVIFVTFLVFLYTIVQPATVREKDRQYLLDYLTLNLIGNSTIEMSTLIINVDEPIQSGKDCINLQSLDEETIPLELRDNLIFKNPDGESLSYTIQNINVIHLRTGEDFLGVITIYVSENFTGLIDDSIGGCDPDPYPVGYLKTFSEIFETKIYKLNESYYADYEGLKASLGIPEGTEFNFYIYDSMRSEPPIISAKIQEPPTDRSVFVEETPIQYADEEGNILFGFLVVEIW